MVSWSHGESEPRRGLGAGRGCAAPRPGGVHQQTFTDTYAKVGFAELYDRKTPITAADLLDDRVVRFFEQHDVRLLRMPTDRGSEYCGDRERHEYELYLAVEDIDHSRTKTKSPKTNGICERFHKTVLNEFYRVAFREKAYRSLDGLQSDLDSWITEYNEVRPHQGRVASAKLSCVAQNAPLFRRRLFVVLRSPAGERLVANSVAAQKPIL
jgi:transposase InsO family protein